MGRPPKNYSDVELTELRDRRNALRRIQYQLDGGKRKAENQAWKDAHREQTQEAGRLYMLRRRALDPLAKEKDKAWRRANPEKIRRYNRRSYYEGRFGREYSRLWAAKKRVQDPVLFMLRNAKNRAKKLGLPFALSRADIAVPDVCPVLGIKIEKANGPFKDTSPSMDRMNPALGYVPSNVHVISNRANLLKKDGTLEEFKKIVAYMERHG